MSTPAPSKTEVYEHLEQLLVQEFGIEEIEIRPTIELVNDLDSSAIVRPMSCWPRAS